MVQLSPSPSPREISDGSRVRFFHIWNLWNISEVGDQVAEDELVAEIETDKTSVECPAPQAGTIVELLVEDGSKVTAKQKLYKLQPGSGGGAAPVRTFRLCSNFCYRLPLPRKRRRRKRRKRRRRKRRPPLLQSNPRLLSLLLPPSPPKERFPRRCPPSPSLPANQFLLLPSPPSLGPRYLKESILSMPSPEPVTRSVSR